MNNYYAQTLILVNLMLVKIFTQMVTTRKHEDVYGRNLVEMDPTSLPQLSSQLRDQTISQKHEKHEIQHFPKIQTFERVLNFERIALSLSLSHN